MLDPGLYSDSYNPDGDILCLDFANTLNWRTSDHPHDWLDSYNNLVGWGQVVGLVTEKEAILMRQAAGQSTQSGLEVLRRAISLREAIYRIITTFKTELPPQDADLAVLNHEFQIANQHRILAYTPEGWDWQWDENPQALDRILWPVAQSAANLLTSETLDRVGECQGEDCGWLFLDASKNKSRRWCSMDDCGNREKARQFYRRKKEKLDTP